MAHEKLVFDAVKLMERIDSENQAKSAQELILDDSNEVAYPGFPYSFEALGERILVSIDVFKSGYECKQCQGKGRIKYNCPCENGDRPGMRYTNEQIETLRTDLGDDIAIVRANMLCNECHGDFIGKRVDIECPSCKGRGATVLLPDESKNLPTTGVIVSMGPAAEEKSGLKRGDRILFGAHAGSMIPTKAGLMFKYMDWYQAALKIKGADGLSAFDFIIQADS